MTPPIVMAFVQARIFLALCALGVGLLFCIVVRLHVARAARRIRVGLIARIGERERMARELHDTLLQGVQGLLLSVHALAARARRGEQVADALDRVLADADDVIAESRDRAQDLHATMLSYTTPRPRFWRPAAARVGRFLRRLPRSRY